jgi:hypothetical protein
MDKNTNSLIYQGENSKKITSFPFVLTFQSDMGPVFTYYLCNYNRFSSNPQVVPIKYDSWRHFLFALGFRKTIDSIHR